MYNTSMVTTLAPQLLKLLSNDLRWQLLITIAQSDLRVQEIMQAVGQPQNLVSYHLKKLHAAGLVIEHRSIADGREVYYGIHLRNIREIFKNIQDTLHPGLTIQARPDFPTPPLRILILCTHNSARSQMAEGFINAKSLGKIEVFSAGANPQPVNPLAIQVMADFGIDIHAYQAKNQESFTARSFDYVITVCDRARETCPIFPGSPILIHWSVADPTTATSSPQTQIEQFKSAAHELEERIDFLLAGIGKKTS
jgi:protein-tyrosine-phosphatase/DNA-binding transcriptional ArsR family regulator